MSDKISNLCIACAEGDLKRVKDLIGQGAKVNFGDPYHGKTALFHATAHNRAEVVRYLLEDEGAVAGKREAFWLACEKGYVECVKHFLHNGVDVLQTYRGVTFLGVAANFGQEKVIEVLLENSESSQHATREATQIACNRGHVGCVQLLHS